MESAAKFDSLCPPCVALLSEKALKFLRSPWIPGDTDDDNRRKYGINERILSLRSLEVFAKNGCHLCNLMINSLQPFDWPRGTTEQTITESHKMNSEEVLLSIGFENIFSHPEIVISSISPHPIKGLGRLMISPVSSEQIDHLLRSRSTASTAPNILDKALVDQIKLWTAKCLDNHRTCCNSWTLTADTRKLPTRLLEVRNEAGRLQVRVVCSEHLEPSTTYLTLSHCWGSKKFVTLTTELYDDFCQTIPLEVLSRTFRDALELTWLLDCRYIWIDSLCIIQNSNEDWLRQSSVMGGIYAHSLLSIAATAAENGDGGLFHQDNSTSRHPCLVRLGDEQKGYSDFLCYPSAIWVDQVERSPLGKRGWVLQERILAPRVIHCTSSQLFWECCEGREAQFLPHGCLLGARPLKNLVMLPNTSVTDLERHLVHHDWEAIILNYSGRNLSFFSDKLVAISGLASRFSRQLGLESSDYLAGLWKARLPADLLWSGNGIQVPGRAPSWSWASIDGPIYLDHPHDPELRSSDPFVARVRVVDYQQANFDRIFSGSIYLQGPLCILDLVKNISIDNTFHAATMPFNLGWELVSPRVLKSKISWDTVACSDYAETGPTFLMPVLTSNQLRELKGLVLGPTGLKAGQFRRLGMICVHCEEHETPLKTAMKSELLKEGFYVSFDLEKGFTIEIV